MSNKSKIEWTDSSWQVTSGCTPAGTGCQNCYAIRDAWRMAHNPNPKLAERYAGTVERHVNDCLRWTGKINLLYDQLEKPLHWKKPRRVFVNSLSDLFHRDVPDEFIAAVFGVMATTPHTYQVPTKRSERMRKWFNWVDANAGRQSQSQGGFCTSHAHAALQPFGFGGQRWPLSNVWLGASASTKPDLERVAADLANTPAAVRFYSFEPLLGDLGHIVLDGISWVIVGGESGPGARPMHPQWARDIRDQCVKAGVPFFFKQWGEWETYYDRDVEDPDWQRCPEHRSNNERYLNLAGGYGFHGDRVVAVRRIGKKHAGRELDGCIYDQMPER